MDPSSPRHIEEMLAFGAAGPSEEAWRYLLDDLVKLQAEFRAFGARTGLLLFPYRYNLKGDPRDNPWNVKIQRFKIDPFKRLENFAQKRGFIWIDLLKAFQTARSKMSKGLLGYNPLFDPLEYNHPNSNGHLIAATATFRTLRNLGFDKDPKN